jgi:hypothetical protein
MTRQRPADDFPQTRTRYADPVTNAAQDYNVIRDKPLSLRDKFGLVAQNISMNLGGQPLPTRRQRDEARAQGRLGQQMEVEKARILREQGQMVPFTLPDGTTTYVPAKSVGALGSRQQGQAANLDERKRMNNAHIKRWDTMGAEKGREQAMREYQTGMYDDNPEMLDYIGQTYAGQALPPVRTQVTVDGQTFKVKPETAASITARTTEGQKNREATNTRAELTRAQRDRLFDKGEEGKNYRIGQGGSSNRKIPYGERKDMAETVAVINGIKRELTAIDDQIEGETDANKLRALRTKRDEIVERGALNADKLNQIDPDTEWGSGTGGYPYSKPRGQSSPAQSAPKYKSLADVVEKFKNSPKNTTHRDPTAAELQKLKQKYQVQ